MMAFCQTSVLGGQGISQIQYYVKNVTTEASMGMIISYPLFEFSDSHNWLLSDRIPYLRVFNSYRRGPYTLFVQRSRVMREPLGTERQREVHAFCVFLYCTHAYKHITHEANSLDFRFCMSRIRGRSKTSFSPKTKKERHYGIF